MVESMALAVQLSIWLLPPITEHPLSWMASLLLSTNLVCHLVSGRIRVEKILTWRISWCNTVGKIGIHTSQGELVCTIKGMFWIVAHKITLSLLCSIMQHCSFWGPSPFLHTVPLQAFQMFCAIILALMFSNCILKRCLMLNHWIFWSAVRENWSKFVLFIGSNGFGGMCTRMSLTSSTHSSETWRQRGCWILSAKFICLLCTGVFWPSYSNNLPSLKKPGTITHLEQRPISHHINCGHDIEMLSILIR